MPNYKMLVTATTADVIAGLDPAIHQLKNLGRRMMDTWVKAAYDD
jgi:hypothetical protein